MKTYCKPKTTRIEDPAFNLKAVTKCLRGGEGKPSKLQRKDFRNLLASTGVATRKQLRQEYESKECTLTNKAIQKLAKNLTSDIRNRSLELSPVRQFRKTDGLSGKTRDICQEGAKQQVHEYILVNALLPLFKAKFLPFQYGSIPGRGPEMGKRKIERILRKVCKGGKIDAIQGDVRHAYQSTSIEVILNLLRRDIGKNKVLIWYAGAVMENYPDGVLLIGGYFSSYAYNYVMSYVLRYMLSMEQVRRGTRKQLVMAVVCYADDFIIFGNLSQLEKAMKKTARWAHSTLGLDFKPGWKMIRMPGFEAEKDQKTRRACGSHQRTVGVDMMGYVVRGTYTIIRRRIFKRIRRNLIRAGRELLNLGYVPWWRALKLSSAKGRLKNADCRGFKRVYNVKMIMRAAEKSVSARARKEVRHETAVCNGTC